MSDYSAFIFASYALAGLVVAFLIGSIMRDYIVLRRKLDEASALVQKLTDGQVAKGEHHG